MLYLLLVMALGGLVSFFGFFTVKANRPLVLFRWGRYTETLDQEGIHFRFPIGLDVVEVQTHLRILDLEEQVVENAGGDLVRASGTLEYRVANTYQAATSVEDVDVVVGRCAAACVRRAATSYPKECLDAERIKQEIAAAVEPCGLAISQVRVDCAVVVRDDLRPAMVQQWASAVVQAHQIIQGAALSSAQKLHEASGTVAKPSRAEFLAAATVSVAQVGEQLAQLGRTPPA